MKTFQELIDKAGGMNQICLDFNVHKITVQRWLKSGFPDKYVVPLATRYNIATTDIRKILKKLRKK